MRFLRYVARRFVDDRCLSHATNLSFATLLSLVPLMTVSIAILAAFQVFDQIIGQLQDFIFTHFTPKSASIAEVKKYFLDFSKKATQLTGTGILFLVLTSLLLMYSIDRALNEIWHVKVRRRLAQGFLVYWSVLTIGPLFIGISVALSSYVASLPLFAGSMAKVENNRLLLTLGPYLATLTAFTLMYVAIPNRPVSLKHALVGGLLASVLFELAKNGFTFYLTNFPTYRYIYGALSTIPIFMLWVYLSWIVILFGAEVAHSLSSFRVVRRQTGRPVGLADMVKLLGLIHRAQSAGRPLGLEPLLEAMAQTDEQQLIALLDELEQHKVLSRSEAGEWVLLRDPREFTLYDLYLAHPYRLPTGASGPLPPGAEALGDSLQQLLAVPLQRFFELPPGVNVCTKD